MKLSKEIKTLCLSFAKEVVETNVDMYARRGQFNKHLIISQIYDGKLAEWAIYEMWKNEMPDLTEPDMEIYPAKRKNFNADLSTTDKDFHIKCQNAASFKRYGHSWIFQRNDALVSKPTDRDFIVFCELTQDGEVNIIKYCAAKEMVWGETKLEHLRKTKVAVYL